MRRAVAGGRTLLAGFLGMTVGLPATSGLAGGAPVAVQVVKAEGGARLLRAGKPYLIKGAGGDGPLKVLAEAGGNSIRTWGVDKAGPILDEARKLGLTVTVGIWLGHERHGFNYNDADQVAKQYETARQAILRYKDHPALLMWGIGNEMEGFGKGDNAAIWSAVNDIARLAKELDPNHPTMTVIAEIGGDKVKNSHRLCSAVDILGINSYGGAASLPERYKKAGGTKPYVLTEFGPPGQWEIPKTAWGAAPELTSTEKAEAYRRVYQKAVLGAPGLCLGSYAFTWGHKQEATATWYGLFLPDGHRTAAIDALTELWSGKPPRDRCPTVQPLKLDGPARVKPGATVKATLVAADPDGDPLKVQWILYQEGISGEGGDAEQVPPSFPEAIVLADKTHAELTMPQGGGGYRLFAFVHDDHGGAAMANVPLFVDGPSGPPPNGKTARLPLVVYDEADHKPAFIPSGWMGNTKAIKLDPECAEAPHAGKTCLRADYTAGDGWGGVVWQDPPNDWGDRPGGYNLSGAKQLTFWARGAKGDEVVTFEFGLIGPNKKFPDTARGKLDKVALSTEWQQFRINLTGKDLSRIKTGFTWVIAASGQPITFYLDDIRYE